MKFMKPILILCLFVFGANSILACQPVIQRHTKYFRKAKAVFIGKVVDISLNNSSDTGVRREAPDKIKFAVEKSWKDSKSEITVIADNNMYPCNNLEFRVGERYLVYAFGWRKTLFVPTHIGNRSRPLKLELEDDITKKEFKELNSFWFRFKSRLWFF